MKQTADTRNIDAPRQITAAWRSFVASACTSVQPAKSTAHLGINFSTNNQLRQPQLSSIIENTTREQNMFTSSSRNGVNKTLIAASPAAPRNDEKKVKQSRAMFGIAQPVPRLTKGSLLAMTTSVFAKPAVLAVAISGILFLALPATAQAHTNVTTAEYE